MHCQQSDRRYRDGVQQRDGHRAQWLDNLANGDLVINGIAIGAIAGDASAVVQGRNAETAINAASNLTGVTAVANASTGALTLTAADGRNIEISAGNAASTTVVTNIFNATGLDASTGADPALGVTTNLRSTLPWTVVADGGPEPPTASPLVTTLEIDGVTYEFRDAGTAASGNNVKVEVVMVAERDRRCHRAVTVH